MPWTPTSERASLTSSSLNGLMMASIFFIDGGSVPRFRFGDVSGCLGWPELWLSTRRERSFECEAFRASCQTRDMTILRATARLVVARCAAPRRETLSFGPEKTHDRRCSQLCREAHRLG